MRESEAFSLLEGLIQVTPQQVTIAKSFILKNFDFQTSKIIEKFLLAVEAKIPDKIVIHDTAETEAMIKHAAEGISWTLACCEAIWGLISANMIIPSNLDLNHVLKTLPWTTVVPGSGGTSSGWQLDHLSIPIPRTVLLPRSISSNANQFLSDPDLFLHSLDINGIHKEVDESLREAVLCFKHGLFLACLAMLGKASEGAWIELGLDLSKSIPQSAPIKAEKVRDKFEDPFIGIGKKIVEILKLYERTDIFSDLQSKSGVKVQDLRNAVIWSDAVRESRNSVHYGVKPSMPNSYEKVAALLIGAVPHLRLIFRIIEATGKDVE